MLNHLTQKIRDLMSSGRRWGHSNQEAENLVRDALSTVEASSRDHEVRGPGALVLTTFKRILIKASHHAKRITAVSLSGSGEDAEGVTVISDPHSGPEEVCSAQHGPAQIEALLVQQWGRMTYEVFMYQRSGHTYLETALKFNLRERAVQEHIARAMFVLINHRAGERE